MPFHHLPPVWPGAPGAPNFASTFAPHPAFSTHHQAQAGWHPQPHALHPYQQAYAPQVPPYYAAPPAQLNSLHFGGAPLHSYPQSARGSSAIQPYPLGPSSRLAPSPIKIDGEIAPIASQSDDRQDNYTKLENTEKATNVYIRLLPPEARDSDLLNLGRPYGQVLSVRALMASSIKIDIFGIPREETACKGVGFILYKSPEEAEKAVIGLNAEGFEVSYAKESISLKLRRLADENTTNLYLTNLPAHFENHDVVQLLAPATVLSVRILRENDALPSAERGDGGASKGIGFARLEDRDIADQTIARLNGLHLPGAELPLRIRYADSREQRQLKQQIGDARGRRSKACITQSRASPPTADLGRLRPFDSPSESPSSRDTSFTSIFDTPTRANTVSSSMQWTPTISPASSMSISPTKPSSSQQFTYFDRPAPPVFFPQVQQGVPSFYGSIRPSAMALGAFNGGPFGLWPAPSPALDPDFALLAEQEAQAFYGHAPSPLASKANSAHRSDDLSPLAEASESSAFSFGSGAPPSDGSSGSVSAGPHKTRFSIEDKAEEYKPSSLLKRRTKKSGSISIADRSKKEGNGPGSDAWLARRLESRKSLP